MRIASVANVKNHLSAYLTRARRRGEPILITRHGRPYAMIQSVSESDLDELAWKQMARRRLATAWEGEPDELYDYL